MDVAATLFEGADGAASTKMIVGGGRDGDPGQAAAASYPGLQVRLVEACRGSRSPA